MPSRNPKHKKKKYQSTPKMGVKKATGRCILSDCNKPAKYHEAMSNITNFSSQLNWQVDSKKKTRRAGLCKTHYKEYKKLKKKEDKYKRIRDFNPKDSPKPTKTYR